ncbi:hypothetical protein DFH08DRAFT_803705 [Mycena albidolilacea]|uniref:TauD/TfdA-like domain-containing protein n=1 Tax=Mycena albidolilacea TaxID=1033008 RepID=A0AAD7EYC6_9AGAR|nr:hypothetical protein DFH08DRAFT_803705 [Mycena albidolilacea]
MYSQVKYPALQPFEHVGAGFRALKHPGPRSFLANSSAIEMSPEFGLDVRGCNLAELTAEHKDQLALESRAVVWSSSGINRTSSTVGPAFILNGLVASVLCTSTPLQAILTAITKSTWFTNCSFELQPAGLTTFFLLAQPKTGGDTLYSSQVLNFRSLSPIMQDFLRTLKATHGRRQPAFEAGRNELWLNFLYDHIVKCGDHQARIKWEPMSVVIWDNRITAHTATYDYAHMKDLRHGARISAQAERPIPAVGSMKMVN